MDPAEALRQSLEGRPSKLADVQGVDCVEIKVPCKPEYVGVVRLAILGVANRMDFSFDQVEDIRLAVGEVCAAAVERAVKNNRQNSELIVRSCITADCLTIDVLDAAGRREEPPADVSIDSDPRSIADLLITLLVDEVNVTSDNDGTRVSLIKYAG